MASHLTDLFVWEDRVEVATASVGPEDAWVIEAPLDGRGERDIRVLTGSGFIETLHLEVNFSASATLYVTRKNIDGAVQILHEEQLHPSVPGEVQAMEIDLEVRAPFRNGDKVVCYLLVTNDVGGFSNPNVMTFRRRAEVELSEFRVDRTADLTGDGRVGIEDFRVLAAQFGEAQRDIDRQ